ncbi:PREDICTED: uncharacterized protein LOC106330369 [Brassica oleracea var. oleracea]|uniref:uncharacterized protein LOC106330369 n=1 Tax=Brassica oleracea var. oleracea TaxID=109376 RepID=UPI0006A7378F|nr:PREDICTED: uncharacterized protein LOC106330369 [Brassica oleracea var. oleracea]
MEDSPRLSKSVRSLVQLKDFLITFMRCEIGDGQDALFWFDSWTELGPLLTYVGDSGPRRLCLRLSATVADATRNGTWNLPSARTQQIETQQIFMTTIPPPDVSFGKDKYLWLQSDGSFGPSFSTKGTWDHIRESSPIQSWSKILCHATSSVYSGQVKTVGNDVPEHRVWPNPPNDVHSAAAWIGVSRARARDSVQSNCIIKLLLQSAIYHIWKERNARIFTSKAFPPAMVRAAVDRQIRDRLLSIPPSPRVQPPFLQFFFACTRPP